MPEFLACHTRALVGGTSTSPQWASRRVADRAQELQLPAFAAETEAAKTAQDKVIALAGERCTALAAEGD
jgi:serine/threonine-protein kinase HipA